MIDSKYFDRMDSEMYRMLGNWKQVNGGRLFRESVEGFELGFELGWRIASGEKL